MAASPYGNGIIALAAPHGENMAAAAAWHIARIIVAYEKWRNNNI